MNPRAIKKPALGGPLGYALFAGAVAAAGYAILKERRPRYSFRDKVTLITGGSRGLGVVLGRHLAAEGARLAICARDGQELDRAGRDLRNRGAEVIEIVCDVRKRTDAESAIRRCIEYFGRLDVLVNNAGIIQVGPLESQTEQDFRDAMDTHFWGTYFMMQAAIPEMKRAGSGRIANIASIGAKIAVPHLLPYCASKFAVAGLSAGMCIELAKAGIKVTTVCPGLMRTGSHINAEFKGQNKKEFAMFSIVDAFPLASITAESAARQILEASRSGRAELIISPQAKLAATLNAVFPETMSAMLSLADRILPTAGPNGRDKSTGLESSSVFSPSILTANIDAASERNNELKPGETL